MIFQKSSTKSWTTVSAVSLATTLVATTVTVVWIHQRVSRYGWEGTFHLIWEGSPYRPRIRDRMEMLDEVENSSQLKESKVARLEDAQHQAQSEVSSSARRSIDCKALLMIWEERADCNDLRLALATLSDDLDKMAARLDAILSEGEPEVKSRKKSISSALVKLMERIDRLVHNFQVASGNV